MQEKPSLASDQHEHKPSIPRAYSPWSVNLLVIFATACGALPPFLLGSVAVNLRADLGLAISQLGILTSVFFGSAALSSIAAGRVVEKLGPTLGMRISCVTGALCLAAISVAGSLTVIVFSLIVSGVVYALVQVSANVLIAERMVRTRQALSYGIKQAGIPAATLVGGVAVPTIAVTLGWRWVFAAGAGLAALAAAAIPERHTGATRRRNQHFARPDLSTSTLVALTAGSALAAAAATSLGAYLVVSSAAMGLAAETAGLLLAAASLTALLTRIGVGWLADRVAHGHLVWVSSMILSGALGYLGLSTGAPALLAPATLLAFSGGWGWPGLFNFVIVMKNPSAPAAATGITQTGPYIGGITGPLMFGLIAQWVSYSAAWLFAASLAVLGAGLIAEGGRRLSSEELANS